MPLVLKAPNSADVMKTEEGNDSLDAIIKQAIGKEPCLSFSRAGDNPVQWIQLLHALDQQELPGWPLLSPLKVQMQKCDKCSREFCSPINYRRHIRVHHRLKKLDKDSLKNRDLLAAFWDKLSLEETKEVLSFKNVSLEGVTGSDIIKNLTAVTRKPGFSGLPHLYLRAGSALLDLVQGRPSRFPVSSQELFGILDDASEKTFLFGMAVSMQKYVFDGEAAKIGVETKNIVACTSFLVEQKLVKAWLADKDAEALRCQKLLVEEEEAAQKKQAELLERKRQKKLRLKEQKAKEKADGEGSINEMLEAILPVESTARHSETKNNIPDILQDHSPSSFEAIQRSTSDEDEDFESHSGFPNDAGNTELGSGQNVEQRTVPRNGRRHNIVGRWQVLPKSQQGLPNGLHGDQNSQTSNIGAMQKHVNHKQLRAAPITNGSKVWSRKPKPEINGDRSKPRVQKEAINQADEINSHEVLIGSISVTVGNSSQEGNNIQENQGPKKINLQDKVNKFDSIQKGMNRSTVKLWRPVSRNGTKGSIPVQNGNGEAEVDDIAKKGAEQNMPDANCPTSSYITEVGNGEVCHNHSVEEEGVQFSASGFSIDAAKAFLAQRWKEAISADHVKLVLSPDSEPPGCRENDSGKLNSTTAEVADDKFRTDGEKSG